MVSLVPIATAAFPSVFSSAGAVTSTFTTTRPSRLAIHWEVTIGLGCTNNNSGEAWLQLDGVNLAGSQRITSSDAANHEMSFDLVTPSAVAAGDHTLATRVACFSGGVLTGGSSGLSGGVVEYVADSDPTAP
jgi:hypothetical protein